MEVCPLNPLTERERDVLALVAQGRSNTGISQELGVTIRTIECHINRIFTKLDLAGGEDSHRRVLATLAHLGATQVA